MVAPNGRYVATRYKMIKSVRVHNFRCFSNLSLDDCRRVTAIVGPNGAGKTALLEAIFLALASGPEVTTRMHQWRGSQIYFTGSPRDIETAMWNEFFNRQDTKRPVAVSLTGTDRENRSVKIQKIAGSLVIPKTKKQKRKDSEQPIAALQLAFEWTDSNGRKQSYQPVLTKEGLVLPGATEGSPDSFFFASSAAPNSAENATRFSGLARKVRKHLVSSIKEEYPLIQDLMIESKGGVATLCAEIADIETALPLTTVSSSISRTVSILLAIVSQPKCIVLIDEIENGVYFKNYESHSRLLLKFASEFDAQLILTTHSDTWLDGLVSAAKNNLGELAMWRLDREKQVEIVDGETLRDTRTYGGEVR